MASDLRFHIASLAAVFIALGLGILVGTAFVSTPVVERAVVKQQNRIIQKLDATVGDLRRQTQEAEKNEAAMRALLPRLVAGKLAERRVLVVRVGDYPEAAEQAAEALRQAGASVTMVALPEDAWRRALGLPINGDTQRLIEEAQRLAPLLTADIASPALDAYRDDGRITGDALEGPARLVVLVGGKEALQPPAGSPDARPEELASLARDLSGALAKAWQAAGITVVGAEAMAADISFVPAYQAANIASVDNIDRAGGQIALPFALAGEKAAYGVKPTADRVLPESLTNPATP